jgi:hypothetical protein
MMLTTPSGGRRLAPSFQPWMSRLVWSRHTACPQVVTHQAARRATAHVGGVPPPASRRWDSRGGLRAHRSLVTSRRRCRQSSDQSPPFRRPTTGSSPKPVSPHSRPTQLPGFRQSRAPGLRPLPRLGRTPPQRPLSPRTRLRPCRHRRSRRGRSWSRLSRHSPCRRQSSVLILPR